MDADAESYSGDKQETTVNLDVLFHPKGEGWGGVGWGGVGGT